MLNKYLLKDFITLFIYIQEYQQLVSINMHVPNPLWVPGPVWALEGQR